mgnify:CR=1 FL=1
MDRLQEIFDHQRELMKKYHPIEEANGLLQTSSVPVNLHDKHGQARLKDFMWRTTEEIGEAVDPSIMKLEVRMEEWADALHFLTELSILSTDLFVEELGVFCLQKDAQLREDIHNEKFKGDTLDIVFKCVWSWLQRCRQEPYYWAGQAIFELGLASNELKNRPWKQSHKDTDVRAYLDRLFGVWECFIAACICVGFTPDTLYEHYMGKNKINQERQNNGY